MKNNIIFISNSKGGIKTFEDILIKYIQKEKIRCIIINNISYKKNEKNKADHYKINVLKKPLKTFRTLNEIKDKNKDAKFTFIFSNPIIFVIYFLYIKFFYNRKKIYFFVHSHLTKKNISLYLMTLLGSFLFLFINKIYYVSKFTKKWWSKMYLFPLLSKSSIQYNSVIIPKNTSKKINKKLRLGFVGRIDREKGLDLFLDIAHKNKDNYTFNVFSEQYLKLNNKQKKYVNFFYKKNKPSIYNNIDLLLLTSPIENCPFNVLEAKSYGIPTLSILTKGGVNEIIRDNFDGLIVNSEKKIINLSKSIDKIKDNYKFYSKNSFKEANKYNANVRIPILIKEIIF
jgi:glycosyltransferase involved in cell wall biosynthesis